MFAFDDVRLAFVLCSEVLSAAPPMSAAVSMEEARRRMLRAVVVIAARDTDRVFDRPVPG